MNAPIGGYFGLELPLPAQAGRHHGAAAYQSARAALCALFQAARSRPVRLWLPHYICDAMLQPALAAGVQVRHYAIDAHFNPLGDVDLGDDDWLLYVNYFGLCSEQARRIVETFPRDRVIVDGSQAWFAEPLDCLANIYSPRKFFGVPDGGILHSDRIAGPEFARDTASLARTSHLLKRLADGPEQGYADYQAAEASLADLQPRRMSLLTERMLHSIDQERVREIRNRNFAQLHQALHSRNRLRLPDRADGPLCYPLLSDDETLRARLLARRVFTPSYWQDVLHRVAPDALEAEMVKKIIPLPIDQRYGAEDMAIILEIIHA